MGFEKFFRPTATPGLDITDVTTATTGSNISNFGITLIASTASQAFNIDAPVAGVHKELIATGALASSSAATVIPTSTGVVFISTAGATQRKATFSSIGHSAIIAGNGATQWLVLSNNGVAFAAT